MTKKTNPALVKKLLYFLFVASSIIIISPIASIDIFIFLAALVLVGHIFLQEKLLLVFLFLRPTIDIWRDISFSLYKETTIHLTELFGMVFLCWSCYILFRHKKALAKLPLKNIFLVLLLLLFGSVFYSVTPFITIIESIKFLAFVVFFALGFLCIKKQTILPREVLYATCASAIIPILFGVIEFLSGSGITTFDITHRIQSTFAHPNVFAFFLLSFGFIFIQISIISPLPFWESKKGWRNAVLVLLGLLLIGTFTRAALIGLLVFLTIIGILRYKRMILVLATSLFAFYLIFYPLNNLLIQHTGYSLTSVQFISRITTRSEDADSILWRQQLVQESLPIILRKPLFGYGYGSFPKVWEEYRPPHMRYDDSAESHNDYLRFIVEVGIIGLTCYITLFLLLLHAIWKYHNTKQAIFFAAWVGVYIVISFSDNMLNHTPVMWLTWVWWGMLSAFLYKKSVKT